MLDILDVVYSSFADISKSVKIFFQKCLLQKLDSFEDLGSQSTLILALRDKQYGFPKLQFQPTLYLDLLIMSGCLKVVKLCSTLQGEVTKIVLDMCVRKWLQLSSPGIFSPYLYALSIYGSDGYNRVRLIIRLVFPALQLSDSHKHTYFGFALGCLKNFPKSVHLCPFSPI